VRAALRLWAPPPDLTISEWADHHRRLSPEASPEPGQWNTDRAPYQREVMDVIADPTVEQVVCMWSSQVGKTEIELNAVGYHIDHEPSPILVVLPTLEMAETWSNDRLRTMLRDSPRLAQKMAERSRDTGNTILHKSFPGGHITLAGANSPASLASRPIRMLICDEVDRFPASAGKEGDPILLAQKRTNNFPNRKILMVSSPTTQGSSRIAAAYARSDRRKFWVPCPDCGEMQVLAWKNVVWQDEDPETARYACEACGSLWSDQLRHQAVKHGEWRAERPFRRVAGFWLSELYSPWRRLAETVGDFLAAKDTPEEAPDWERLLERREPLLMGVVPPGALVLTAGLDNQSAQGAQRLEMAVWAWGPGYERWLIDTHVISGNPGSVESWDRVAELLAHDYPTEDGGVMRIAMAGADTGGQHTAQIYEQIRRLRDPHLIALKGVPGFNRASPVTGPTYVDVTANGVKVRRGLKLWTVSGDVFKAELYSRLHLGRGEAEAFPPGWVHLPQGLQPEEVKQLVGETLVTTKDRRGFAKMEWKRTRANEQLDMAVYARAALSVMGSDRFGDRFWGRFRRGAAAPPPPPPEDLPPPTSDPVQLPQNEAPRPGVTQHNAPRSGRSGRYA
jgi:phage terminase large subunit GpA-like protein